jgi:uncharacterized protein YqjF (DUF2071 family)
VTSTVESPFLTAEWRKLAMANYTIDPQVLLPYLPRYTELDVWNGACYVSLIAFMFENTRLKGIRIPFHGSFEEVNLRFYVRQGSKRGVVFIKEIVPLWTLSFTARLFYNENYEAMRMGHAWKENADSFSVDYYWKHKRWNTFSVKTGLHAAMPEVGSNENFITEHYWGYTRRNEEQTLVYEVEHTPWQVYPVHDYNIDVEFGDLYGPSFAHLSKQKPQTVFLAEGSAVSVKSGKNLLL